MKYLKKFETLLSFKDPNVVNHPLLSFSIELEKILKILKNADNYDGSNVRKYFDSDGQITDIKISYKDKPGRTLFSFKINLYDLLGERATMVINHRIYTHRLMINNYNKNSEYLFNFIIDNFNDNNFDTKINDTKNWAILIFPISEINNVVEKLQDIDAFFSAKKYNIS